VNQSQDFLFTQCW